MRDRAPLTRDHWGDHALQWSRITSPLRPCAADVELMREALGETLSAPASCGLLLGVTPELTRLSPHLWAIDHNPNMIDQVSVCRALAGKWQALPLRSRSMDFAIGDGSLTVIPLADYVTVFSEIKRVLKPQQSLVLRLFVAPDQPETLDQVIRTANDNLSFHTFKWRLAMAMAAQSANPSIPVSSIHAMFEQLIPQREQLKWPRAIVDTIDVYRDLDMVYGFATLAQIRREFAGIFREISLRYAHYELAERCPIISLRAD